MASGMLNRRALTRAALVVLVAAVVVLLRATLFAPEVISVRVVAVEKGRVERRSPTPGPGTVKARRRRQARARDRRPGCCRSPPRRRGRACGRASCCCAVDDSPSGRGCGSPRTSRRRPARSASSACLVAERAGRDRGSTQRLAKDGLVAHDWDDRVERASRERPKPPAGPPPRRWSARGPRWPSRKAELDKTVLRAPFDGIVADTFDRGRASGRRPVAPGAADPACARR